MTLVASALILFSSGCAYFNTFYHAKKYYAKAVRVQEESASDKLSSEAIRAYDEAIEKCVKVIVEHGGGWNAGIDDALFLMGASYYGKREYQIAIEKFSELMLNYPDSDHVPEALFYTGLCYHEMQNYGTASRVFDRVLREYPDMKRKDEIYFITAQGHEANRNEAAALREYRRVVYDFGGGRKREDALDRMGDIYFERGDYDSARVVFEELARSTQEDELYFETELKVGACLVRLGESEAALDIYEAIVPETPERNEQGGRVWMAMAEAENRRGRHEEAIEHLQRVSEHFANRGLGVESDFRLGYTYEVYLQDYEKAREAYESATASRQRSVFREQADRRLQNLSYLEELQESLDGETAATEQRAEAALKVAEFTLFESDDPEGALAQYADVIEEFPGSEAAVRAAYARAWVLQTESDSLSEAASAYANLIERYPASPQAEMSLAHLKELGGDEDRRLDLMNRVQTARAKAQRVADSLAVLDSLAAATAKADSLAAAQADSIARAQEAPEEPADREAASEAARAASGPPGETDSSDVVFGPDSTLTPLPGTLPGTLRATSMADTARTAAVEDSLDYEYIKSMPLRPPGQSRRRESNRSSTTESARTSADSVTAPADSVTAPADSVVAPADSVAAPADSVAAPADSVTAPADSVVAPADSVTAPADSVGSSVDQPDEESS